MISELFFEGITNFLCIGRTELKYCLQTSKGLLFRCLISLFNRLINLISESILIKIFKENKFNSSLNERINIPSTMIIGLGDKVSI